MLITPVRPPYLIRKFYSELVWNFPAEEREVYLTFDDGPIPEVTEFVLDCLKAENFKATFFCIGNNVQLHPELYQRLLSAGHAVGNHTMNHVNGWKVNAANYLSDFEKADKLIQTNLFRPPYGRIKKEQAAHINQSHAIVMWDVLSYDFLKEVSPLRCLKNVTENIRPGSIVVFHDSIKARRNMEYALPRLLQFMKTEGFNSRRIEMVR